MFCRFCGKEVNADAAFCPACGKSLVEQPGNVATPSEATSKQPRKTVNAFSLIKIVLYVIGAIILIKLGNWALNPDNDLMGIGNMREAYSLAQQVILDEIRTPASAQFPDFEREFVTQTSEPLMYEGENFNVYTVTAYVDAENAFGTLVRHKYQVKIGLPESRDFDNFYHELVYWE